MQTKRLRLAILLSGFGTTMEQIVKATKSGELPMDVVLVISSKKEAPGLERAKRLGVPQIEVVNYLDEGKFATRLLELLRESKADLVGQYGWLRKTPASIINAFPEMIINQHPGPLDPGYPDFGGDGLYGRRVHAQRLIFVRSTGRNFWTEATAHRVAPEYDKGALLKTERVPIEADDVETLLMRVLPAEHRVQIAALKDFALGKVKEIKRKDRLVLPGEDRILKRAKEAAVLLYPHG